MSDVIVNLSDYTRRAETMTVGASAPTDPMWTSDTGSGAGAGAGLLNASVLRKLDNTSSLARLLSLAEEAMARLERCVFLLNSGDHLGADDQLMGCKRLFSEMLMFRNTSDAAGLLAVKFFQSSSIHAVTDAPALPSALLRALHRIWASPFMKFEEACDLADEIEEAAELSALPGYAEITTELLTDVVQDPSAS